MKKWMLISLNIGILILGILLSVAYSQRLQEERVEMARDAFVSTVDSMSQVSMEHLRTQQEHVNNWAEYINTEGLTLSEALEFLRSVNSNEDISAQVIDTETFEGYSTEENVMTGDYAVNYENWPDRLKNKMQKIADGSDRVDYLHITDSFTNPLTGITMVGFGNQILLKEADGTEKAYLLLRLIPLQELQEQWVFPTGYEDAEIGLINSDGDYVIRSDAMKSENFLEFIRAYNDLTYPEEDALLQKMLETQAGVLEYKNARGQDAYWVYSMLGGDTDDWMIIGYVPVASLDVHGTDWTLIFMVCGILAVLFLIDGAYFVTMNRQLRESMETARQASEAKTRFLSSMSHDIRTPMNAIIGMTTIAKRHLDDRERIEDCLKKITLASNHLLTLINDILDISKVESGQMTLNPMVFSLAESLNNLANIVRPQIHAKSQDFQFHVVNMKREYLYADELRLNQIFINLLSNAVKYTPPNGRITVTLEQQPSETDAKMVRLIYTVADTGIGMTKEFMDTMFQPFTRAKDNRIDTIEGSGLGLAITKQMVDAMAGTISVESEPGKGSTFRVEVELPAAENMTDDLMLPPMRMLIVDDDAICLETTADMLASLGVQSDLAESGEKAVSMAVSAEEQGTGYPVILLDWKMPGMDGIETAREIRRQVGDQVPILVLTAFDWSEIEEEARAAGINGFINKPLFRSSIYTTVNDLLKLQKEQEPQEESPDDAFRGAHLLVAEDNDMNWEIIKELLGFYGITADRAENGEICVQRLEESMPHSYLAVLMDIQMPVMNGLQAARAIRKSPLPHMRNTPIIAMTADAFAEDVRACLDAGMDGHVAKPVDMKKLLEELRKCTLGLSESEEI